MANELPEDLVTQILICLPVVSLLRFRSVCKSWYALINHQNFITKHLLHNKNSSTHLLLTMRDKSKDYSVSTISCETLKVDAKTNDYKIIHLFTLYDPRYENFKPGRGIPQKEVNSLSADSWRKVNGPSCFVCSAFPSTCINGMVSWNATIEDREKLLLSFSLTDEVFLETPLQPLVEVNRQKNAFSWCWNLFVLNESTVMAVGVWDGSTKNHFDIWLLLEVGVKNSWIKLFTIELDSKIDDPLGSLPLGFSKNDMTFFEISDGRIGLYDRFTKKMTFLQIGCGHRLGGLNRVQPQLNNYMETLVSVKGMK